ncbi:MAG: hypothetical protein LV480_10645 [Methylacidiphilales bacterium]|nr:hypothetical protein [Candidatus Methylacidiphilales bacterium]
MNALDEIIDELVTRTKTKKLNTSFIRAEFHQTCCTHFVNVVLPELQRFDLHLRRQEVLITINALHQCNKNVLQAGVVIEYPVNTNNVLDIRYDFTRQDLTFSQVVGGRRRNHGNNQHVFNSFAKVTSPKVYDMVEYFVQSVFGAKLV